MFPGLLSYVPPCESSCLCCLAGTTEHSPVPGMSLLQQQNLPGQRGEGGFMEMMSQSSSDAAPRLEEMKEAQGSCRNAPGLLQPLLRAPLSRPGCPPWLPARRGSREAPAGAGMGTAGTSGCPQLLPLRISWRIRLYPGPGDDLQPL